MANRWIGLTLIAVCLGPLSLARAQYLPCPGPSAPPPEPMPTEPSMQPPATPSMPTPSQSGPAHPGPMNGLLAPRGPSGEKLDLPDDIKNAFPEKPEIDDHCGVYAGVGAFAFMQHRLGHLPVALLDASDLKDGSLPPQIPIQHAIFSLSDIDPTLAWGPKVTLGYFSGPEAFEFTGFYMPDQSDQAEVGVPGRLSSFFGPAPLGFEGDNGMWLHSDLFVASLRTTMADAEFNYRRWGSMYSGMEWIYGIRYFDVLQRLDIYSGDDDLTFHDVLGRPDPTREASYIVRTHSHILGPQLGWEGSIQVCPWLQIGGKLKGCWGANFVNADVRLERGDGFRAFDVTADPTQFSHLYEFGAFLDWMIWDHGRLHVGYDCMFVLHAPIAQDQVNFDLTRQFAPFKENGNTFYQGPVIELQILW